MSGKIIQKNQPCLLCKSSDATQIYEDRAYCFSCGKAYDYEKEYKKKHGGEEVVYKEDNFRRRNDYHPDPEDYADLPTVGWKDRLIPKVITEHYRVKFSYDSQGKLDNIYFPFYDNSNKLIGYKRRNLHDKKDMSAIGKINTLFGLESARNGGKRIVITEGEIDCLSVALAWWQRHKNFYPVVSMGGTQQVKYLLDHRDTLRKYDEVIIYFDNDEQGQKAAAEAARIIGADKAKIVRSSEKDANDTLTSMGIVEGGKKILSYIYDAAPYSPAGIIQGEDTWDKYKEHQNLTYIPWPSFLARLNELTFGRALGTITMFAAGTGIGKSTLLREDIYYLLQETDYKIGACFLEEDVGETVEGIMGLHLNKRLGLPTTEKTEEEERKAWEETVGLPGRTIFLDHQGSLSDDSLLDKLEYMILSGCKILYLDHITIAISEVDNDNINAAIDRFMSELLRLVKRHGVWIGVVSHLRKVKSGEDSFESGAPISEDDLKGSGSLKQISFQTVAVSRNKVAENEEVRNKSQLYLLKDRKTGNSGGAGAYRYDKVTGRLKTADDTTFEDMGNFEVIV